MTETLKVVKIFLASPGGLEEERRAAKSLVNLINTAWANPTGYHLVLVGWEETLSGKGRPQAQINLDLEQCEFFIGMIWDRWGTPPSASGPYTSGFQEEFQNSINRCNKTGRPKVVLFFKEIDEKEFDDVGPQLEQVIKFKKSIFEERILLAKQFKDIEEFKSLFEIHIASYLNDLQTEEKHDRRAESQTRSSDDETQQDEETLSSLSEIKNPFSIEGSSFLQNLITKAEDESSENSFSGSEIARFRLLANIIGEKGNDENSLGVHDANILFVNHSNLELSNREKIGLIDCGLYHYSSENTPLWHWLSVTNNIDGYWFGLSSVIGPTAQRIGSISAMRLISEPLPSEGSFQKKHAIESWFKENAPDRVRNAALEYLADCGSPDDLSAIRAEFDRGDYQTTSAAVNAIIRINLRDSRTKGVSALFDLQPNSINSSLLTDLFDNVASISTEILSQGVEHRSHEVRHIVVRLLRERGALNTETARQLTSDSDAAVRFKALQTLVDAGEKFSDAEAKSILIKPKANHGLGILGGFSATDNAGEACWNQFNEQKTLAMSDQDLEQEVSGSLLDCTARFELDNRHFSTRAEKLRADVDDKFKIKFAEGLEKIAEIQGIEGKLVEQTKSLEDIYRKKFTRKGLDIICRKGDLQDLTRVRKTLKSGFVGYSDADIEYFQKYGEWDDIALIAESISKPDNDRSSLSLINQPSNISRYRTASRAIYSLGKTRFAELLNMSDEPALVPYLIVESSESVFKTLADSSIIKLFRSEVDDIRKTSVLKCVRSLPKTRLRKLLDEFISSEEQVYYNVVHWLDFGVSLPRNRARKAADKILKAWQIQT